MVLRLHDTLSRSTRTSSRHAGRVSIYVCGPTVQSPPHVGHVRSAIAFDILRRWLTATGYDVTFLRNVTDIDDKILHNAGHEDIPWWALATRNTRAFTDGVRRAQRAAADRSSRARPATCRRWSRSCSG